MVVFSYVDSTVPVVSGLFLLTGLPSVYAPVFRCCVQEVFYRLPDTVTLSRLSAQLYYLPLENVSLLLAGC